MMASLAELTDNPFVQNTIDSVALRDATDLPKTRIIVRPQNTPDNEPVKQDDSKLQNIIDQLFGLNGKERYQLWPEKLVRDAISAPHDVMTGEIPQYVIDPVTGEAQTSPQMIKAGVDTSSLAGSGGLAGAGSEAGVALGSAPFLRPALKYGEKLYKGKPGQQHMDVIPQELYPTFQKQAMSGEDISNFNFGFLNHKGQFLSREDALKYAIDNGLVDPHSAQYGALTSTLMSDSAKPGAALAAVANTNKPFYSAVENAIAAAKQPKADAQQWLSFLKNQPGVKQEELAHLGLDKLQGSISKDDLLKAVQEGQPQINDIVKGDLKFDKSSPYALPEVIRAAREAGDNPGELELVLANDGNAYRALTKKFPKLAEDEDWASKVSKSVFGGDTMPSGTTKYHKYQLPGGKNYREMLLTLPSALENYNVFTKGLREKYGEGGFDNLPLTNAERANLNKIGEKMEAEDGNRYRSSHWDEPNVLAHIRMNDRTIDGKKTLHLEEIQSDWHQQGRKQGYKGDPFPGSDKWTAVKEGDKWSVKAENGLTVDTVKANSEKEAIDQVARKFSSSVNDRVPDAPFKKTWDELALKKAITEAVKNGYDQISWTPGEAQAARYDLSKQVNLVSANKQPNGKYLTYIEGKDERPLFRNRDGFSDNGQKEMTAQELEATIGKEAAEKIINGKPNKEGWIDLRDKDLKIGGQGMKAFYDKMLVDKMNALTKKYGGKVEQKDLRTVNENSLYKKLKDNDYDPNTVDIQQILSDNGDKLPRWLTDNELSMIEKGDHLNNNLIKQPVHVLKITPELREHVLKKGLPLFSAGVPVFTPVPHNPFKDNYPLPNDKNTIRPEDVQSYRTYGDNNGKTQEKL